MQGICRNCGQSTRSARHRSQCLGKAARARARRPSGYSPRNARGNAALSLSWTPTIRTHVLISRWRNVDGMYAATVITPERRGTIVAANASRASGLLMAAGFAEIPEGVLDLDITPELATRLLAMAEPDQSADCRLWCCRPDDAPVFRAVVETPAGLADVDFTRESRIAALLRESRIPADGLPHALPAPVAAQLCAMAEVAR